MITVLLCAWNEAAGIERLLERLAPALAEAGSGRVVLVDDGSRDGTAGRARRGAEAQGLPLVVLRHEANRGLGAALATGFDWAVRHLPPEGVLVTMDADNTHPPERMAALLAPLATGADVAIASRYRRGAVQRGVPLYRRGLSAAAGRLVGRIAPLPGVRDYTCGYRAYRVAALRRAQARGPWPLSAEPGFAAMLEILLVLGDGGARVAEVPLELHYEERGGASKMRVLTTVADTLRVLARHRLEGRLRPETGA